MAQLVLGLLSKWTQDFSTERYVKLGLFYEFSPEFIKTVGYEADVDYEATTLEEYVFDTGRLPDEHLDRTIFSYGSIFNQYLRGIQEVEGIRLPASIIRRLDVPCLAAPNQFGFPFYFQGQEPGVLLQRAFNLYEIYVLPQIIEEINQLKKHY